MAWQHGALIEWLGNMVHVLNGLVIWCNNHYVLGLGLESVRNGSKPAKTDRHRSKWIETDRSRPRPISPHTNAILHMWKYPLVSATNTFPHTPIQKTPRSKTRRRLEMQHCIPTECCNCIEKETCHRRCDSKERQPGHNKNNKQTIARARSKNMA